MRMHACRSTYLLLVISLVALAFNGCAPALPPDQPEEVFAHTLIAAEQAAIQAESYSVECKIEREEVDRLLAEARQLLLKAKASEAECKKLVKKIPRRRPKPKKKVEEKVEEKKEEKKVSADGPEYSPSDAP